jgi:hypothetical protein
MDYETARRVRGRSVKELTIRNIQQHEGLWSFAKEGFGIGSLKRAVSTKASASITGMIEKVDPLNLLSMMKPGLLQTMLMGIMPFRSSRSKKYFVRKSQQRQREKVHYTKVGPGRATRLRVGDSSADILAKMFNLMQKEHDENLKRWELESEHAQQRKDEEERRHQELLKTIAGMGHVSTKDNDEAEKKKSKSLKEKLEALFKDIMKPIEAIGKFFKDVFKFVEKIFLNIGKGIIELGKGLFGILEFFVGLGKDLAEIAGVVLLKVIKYIGPILGKLFKAVELIFNKVVKSLAELFVKATTSSGSNKPSYSGATTPEQKKKEASKMGRVGSAVAMSSSAIQLMQLLGDSDDTRSVKEKVESFLGMAGGAGTVGALTGGAIGAFFDQTALGAKIGGTIGEVLSLAYLYKTTIMDPKEREEKQRKLFYYGKDAVELMEEKGLTLESNDVKSLIIDHQWHVLIPLMAKEGKTLKFKPDGTYDYDWKNLIPHFEDGDKKEIKENSPDLFDIFINGARKLKEELYEAEFKKVLGEDLAKQLGFGLDFFGDVEKNMATGTENFLKGEMNSIKESLPVQGMETKLSGSKLEFANVLKRVEGIITGADSNNEATTIIMPTVTNTTEGSNMNAVQNEGIGPVRSTDTSLRQCQLNYAIAC